MRKQNPIEGETRPHSRKDFFFLFRYPWVVTLNATRTFSFLKGRGRLRGVSAPIAGKHDTYQSLSHGGENIAAGEKLYCDRGVLVAGLVGVKQGWRSSEEP
jgi:hypothetical protein